MKKVIVSLGGNALIKRGEKGTVQEQLRNVETATGFIPWILARVASVVMTHGNGPVVGNIVLQNEAIKDAVPAMPLYICGAYSAGGIGLMIQEALSNHLRNAGRPESAATIVTRVLVARNDPAFKTPTKPIGPFYSKDEADELRTRLGWSLVHEKGFGWRRVVPSPLPIRVIEAPVIKTLSEAGVIAIVAGGGGVPVTEDANGMLSGVDAVIDKDFATTALARDLGIDAIINLTAVDMVYLDFNGPGQTGIDDMGIEEARRYLKEGHFPPGSMGPKIESAIEFIEAGGSEVVITSPELAREAIEGKRGTRIRV